jgi:TRAP-type transport system small permease protein
MNRVIDGYCRLLEWTIALLLALMVVLVFGNVVMRYALNSGITVSEELSRWLFVWMTFLGAIVALKEHGHLGSDMLVSRLGPAGKKACLLVGHLLMLYTTWLLFSGSLAQARINLEVQAPVTGASVAIFYGAGVVFAASTAVMLLRDLWRILSGQLKESELVMVQESEDMAGVEALHIDQTPPIGQGPHSMPFRR